MYVVIARIFCSGSDIPAVSSATFCCSAGEGTRLELVRPAYHRPMSFHVPALFARRLASRGKYLMSMRLSMVRKSGITGSISIPGMFSISHTYRLLAEDCGSCFLKLYQ